jgi:hypothetical protein
MINNCIQKKILREDSLSANNITRTKYILYHDIIFYTTIKVIYLLLVLR